MVSRRNRAMNGHFRSKTSWESHVFFRKKHANPLKNCQKRDVSDWNLLYFFFPLSSRLILFAKNQRNATFLTLKNNHLTPGVKALIQYLTYGNNVNIRFFMWCDAQRFPSFFLLSRLLCCQRGHPLDWIKCMKLILINIFSETVIRRWCKDWIDSTK